MKVAHASLRILVFVVVATGSLGCAEMKVGVGPFKAMSVEVGPGGVEAKGPSAGPFKTKSVERDLNDKKED